MLQAGCLEAGLKSATVARRLSVLRGTYHQLGGQGLISWETAQDIAAVKAPGVQKNSTPSLTEKQAIWSRIQKAKGGFRSLTEAIDTTTPAGRMMMQMVGAFAEFEREVLRERTKAGLKAARRDGRAADAGRS